MNIVAVCDEGLSLTVLAKVFLYEWLDGNGGVCFLCRNVRLRTLQCVEFVLDMRVRHFFKPWTVQPFLCCSH